MTDKQENFFSMFTVLNGFLTSNSAVVTTIPAFQRAHQKFGQLIEEIKKVDSGRQSIKAGKSDIKSNAKNELADMVSQLASSLYTYAHEHDKPEILNRVDKSQTYYKRLRDTNLILEASDLVKMTQGIETDLLDQGLTAEEIASVTALSAEFEKSMKEMGTSEAEGSTATKSLYQLIGEAKDVVDNQLSVHAEKFKTKNPVFYNQYFSASRIIMSGTRHEKKTDAPATETPKPTN